MFTNRNQASYRAAATNGATQIGLLLVVYDAIAEDLRQAGRAAAEGKIGLRCSASNHALTLVGHLESWVTSLEDATLTRTLFSWYGYLREQLLHLQVRGTEKDFLDLATLVLEVRSSWNAKEQALTASLAVDVSSNAVRPSASLQAMRSGWSA